jgi:hypothetical protein
VTAANSLTGSNVGDAIGEAVTPLPNGDFVVSSPSWAGNTGAVTHIRRGTDVGGMKVSAANSLVGAGSGSRLGSGKNADSAAPVTVLGNGNYVVCSPALGTVSQLKVGAATWVNASAPVVGTANASNSLIGAAANDRVCSDGVVALDGNDNYVVASPGFQAGSKRVGAASWGSGSAGIHGNVSTANSLVGYGVNFSTYLDAPMVVSALVGNGNYTVAFGKLGVGYSDVADVADGAYPVVWVRGAVGAVGYPQSATASYVKAVDNGIPAYFRCAMAITWWCAVIGARAPRSVARCRGAVGPPGWPVP